MNETTDYSKFEKRKFMEELVNELKKDKSEGSYYYTWQANIAMVFKDEVCRIMKERLVGTMSQTIILSREAFHNIANNAAKNFLDLLIKE